MSKYPDRFTEWLDSEGYDEDGGDVEAPTGWFGRAGKNIVVHDSLGFVYRHKCRTEVEAKVEFGVLLDEYYDWENER